MSSTSKIAPALGLGGRFWRLQSQVGPSSSSAFSTSSFIGKGATTSSQTSTSGSESSKGKSGVFDSSCENFAKGKGTSAFGPR